MKKFYHDSAIARILLRLSECYTITLGPFVFSMLKEIPVTVCRHEATHVAQWCEYTFAAGAIYLFAIWALNAPLWGVLAVPFVWYCIYVAEWLIRLVFALIGRKSFRDAYANISFEREARTNEQHFDYLEYRHYFANVKFLTPWR